MLLISALCFVWYNIQVACALLSAAPPPCHRYGVALMCSCGDGRVIIGICHAFACKGVGVDV